MHLERCILKHTGTALGQVGFALKYLSSILKSGISEGHSMVWQNPGDC